MVCCQCLFCNCKRDNDQENGESKDRACEIDDIISGSLKTDPTNEVEDARIEFKLLKVKIKRASYILYKLRVEERNKDQCADQGYGGQE